MRCHLTHSAVYTDLRRLLEEEGGRALADVWLTVPDSTESVAAHRVVLFLRSEFFREKLSRGEAAERIVVHGVTLNALRHVRPDHVASVCMRRLCGLICDPP